MRNVTADITIRATPDRVIDAFLDPKALKGWWGVERHLVEPRPGGMYALAWDISEHGIRYVSSGRIDTYEPGKRLLVCNMVYFNPERAILGPMTFEAVAEPVDPKTTRLTVTQDGYQTGGDWDWYYDAVRDAWPQVLPMIRDYLETTR